MIIKSTITKRTISRIKKVVETIKKKNPPKEKQNWRERERERESIDLFVMDNLDGIGERGGNEVRINLYEN